MSATLDDTVLDFDLDLLHLPNTPFPAAKLKFTSILKNRIIRADGLTTKYRNSKQEIKLKNKVLEETLKKLDSTNEEYKQKSLEYQKALDSITKLESENQKLRINTKKLGDEYVNFDNQLRACRSHSVQLEQLVKLKDEQIEALKKKEKEMIDKLHQVKQTAKNKNKVKEILAWKKKYEELQKQMDELQNDRKRKLSKKRSTTEKNYNDTIASDSTNMEDPSFQDDDIIEVYSPLSARQGLSQPSFDVQMQRESFHDYSRDIVSVDTGCGSSLCSSDNEKFINSPDFVFSPINIGGIENLSSLKFVSTAPTPIPQVKTIEVDSSSEPSVRAYSATSPIPSLNIIKVMNSPVQTVETVEIGLSPIPPDTRDIGTSPIKSLKLVENITSLGLIEDMASTTQSGNNASVTTMANSTQSENKAAVTASQTSLRPSTPIIINLDSGNDEINDDLIVFIPVTMEDNDTPDKPPEMVMIGDGDTNSCNEMDVDDFEDKKEQEVSITNETSVKDIPTISAQPAQMWKPLTSVESEPINNAQVTQISLEDLPYSNAKMLQIDSASTENISSINAQTNQITLEELQSTSAQATHLTSASVEDVINKNAQMLQITSEEQSNTSAQTIKITSANIVIPSLNAPATQTASECVPTACEQVIETTTTFDENKPDMNVKEAQLTSESFLNVPSINVQATQLALSDVLDLPSINVVAAENIEDLPSVNVQVTTSSKCFEEDSTATAAAQEIECLKINNSNNMVKDRMIDNEVEMIFDEMRLNYKLITPLPKTPVKSHCQDDKTADKEELVNIKNLLSNVGNYLMESLSMPVTKLRANVNQLWFSNLFNNADSSNLNDDRFGVPFISDNVVEPLPQSCSVVPERDNLTCSPESNMSVTSDVLEPEDIDQSKSKQDQKIPPHEETLEIDNEDCMDQNDLHLAKDSVCSNDSVQVECSNDSVQVEMTSPTAKRRRARNTRKLTNLSKYRHKCELTKYKIRSPTPLLLKRRLKPKRVELIKRMQLNNASAILNNKEAYAKAAKVMAELNANKSMTNPDNNQNDTSVKEPNLSAIKCTQLPTEISLVNSNKSDNVTNKSSVTKESQSLDATFQESGVPLEISQKRATRSRKLAELFSVSPLAPITTRRTSITSPNVCIASPKDIILSRTPPKLCIVSSNSAMLSPTPAETTAEPPIPAVATRGRFIKSPKMCAASPKDIILSRSSSRPSIVSPNTAVLSPIPAVSATVSSIPAIVTRSRSILSPKSAITSPSLPESSVTSPNLAVISPTLTKPGALSNSDIKAPQRSSTSPEFNVALKRLVNVPPKSKVVSLKPKKESQELAMTSPVPLITSPDSAFTKPITRSSPNNPVNTITSITTRRKNRGVNAETQNINSHSSNNEIQENEATPLFVKRTCLNNSDVQNKRRLLNDHTVESDVPISGTSTEEDALDPKQSILITMISKHTRKTLKNGTKRAPDAILKTIFNKIETCMATVAELPPTKGATSMEQLIDEMKRYDYKFFLLGLMKFLTMAERKAELFGKKAKPPLPQMTRTEQVLLYVITQLRYYWSVDFLDAVLTNIEYRLFKLNQTPDFDVIESVSHFYALLCRCYGYFDRLLMFMVDAMYCTAFKSVPLIRQCLEVAPGVIPLGYMISAKRPIVTCVIYLLHFYKCEDRHNRVQDLRNILQRKFYYQFTEWNETKMLDMLCDCINRLSNHPDDKKALRMAIIIVGKRNGTQWTQNNLVNKLLLPVINKKNLVEYKIAFCLSVLGPLMKPYPIDMKGDCEHVMNQLMDILGTKPSKQIEEAAITSLVFMARHNFLRVNSMLLSRSLCDMSKELEDLLRGHIRTRIKSSWQAFVPKLLNSK